MRTSPRRPNSLQLSIRRGLSLTELLVASTIMTMIAGGMGTLAMTMQTANNHCQSQNMAAQHARMVDARIQDAVRKATASESFPGCVAFSETVGSYTYPDTLVIWRPTAAAVDSAGLPRVKELLVYCPDPNTSNCLLEIRDPNNNATVPALSSTSSWTTLLTSLKTGNTAQRTKLSTLLRVANAASSGAAKRRGCVRFNVSLIPSATQWASYRAGTSDWDELVWPLDIFGSESGQRQVLCQSELQYDGSSATPSSAQQTPVPHFGSATFVYPLAR